MERLIFHIDVNSAYLSWEAVRQLEKTGEDIREVPSAIGGDPARRSGIILAKSILAKKAGVQTGEPVGLALKKCPNLLLLPPDPRLYERNSRAFMKICRAYTPIVEKFSIDECFLDMTGTSLLYPDPVAIAHTIREHIYRELGFTVNIGIGENKLLAKMASDFEKPNRVHTLFAREIPEKLWPLPAGDLFMTGRATAEKLAKCGITTVGEIVRAGEAILMSVLGARHGAQVYASACGRDETPVLAAPEEAKGYSVSTTLETDVTEREEGARVLLALSDSVSARMRADGAKTGCVAVTIRSSAFQNHSHQKTLQTPIDGTLEIYKHALRLFDALWDGETPLRLLGVSLTHLVRETGRQLCFLRDAKQKQEEDIDRVVDDIRARYGATAIVRGAVYRADLRVGKRYEAEIEKDE